MTTVFNDVLTLLVENNDGVLARITGLFGRKGYNIDTLTVSSTDDEGLSRITLTLKGDDAIITQIMAQCEKLIEVRSVQRLDARQRVLREIALFKLDTRHWPEEALTTLCRYHHAALVQQDDRHAVVEVCGKPGCIDDLLETVRHRGLLDMARSGATAL